MPLRKRLTTGLRTKSMERRWRGEVEKSRMNSHCQPLDCAIVRREKERFVKFWQEISSIHPFMNPLHKHTEWREILEITTCVICTVNISFRALNQFCHLCTPVHDCVLACEPCEMLLAAEQIWRGHGGPQALAVALHDKCGQGVRNILRAGQGHGCGARHIAFAIIIYSLQTHMCPHMHICLNTTRLHVQTVFPISSQPSKTPSHSFSSLWFRHNCPSKTTLAQLISH